MGGNSATGNPAMVTVPTITRRIEITIATIGRRMKNLDMALLSRRLRRRSGRIWLGVYRHARTNLLHAFSDHAFARLQPVVNDPERSHPVAGLHVPNADLVIAAHHGNLIGTLHLGNRPLRDEQRGVLSFE